MCRSEQQDESCALAFSAAHLPAQPRSLHLPQREGLDLEASLSLLVDLTDGLSAGQLLEFVQQLAAHVRSRAALQDGTPGPTEEGQAGAGPLVELALELLPSFARPTPEALQELREWSAKAHSPLPPEVREMLGEVMRVPVMAAAGGLGSID